MKAIHAIPAAALAAAAVFGPLMAQPMPGHGSGAGMHAPLMPGLGQVHKIDAEHRRIALKHEASKDMPAMTMVYQVADPAVLAKLKVGDTVRFRTGTRAGAGASTITELQAAH